YIINHGNYEQIKKELEKIIEKRDDYKKKLRKSEEDKREINLNIQKNVNEIIKKISSNLIEQIIEQIKKLAESDDQKIYNDIKKKAYAIGSCTVGDEKAYNVCRNKRPDGLKITLPPDRDEDNEQLDATKAIVEYYKIPIAGSKSLLIPLISKIELHFFLVRICNKDLARKTQDDITPEEIFVDPEKLNEPKLKDYFQILAEYYGEIEYDKTGFCILLEEEDTDKIEETQRPNAIKLVDKRNLDQRIKNSKLLPNLINDLQQLRKSKLDNLHLEQYGYYIDLKDKTENIATLNNLFDTINNDKILTVMQISILLKSITNKIFKINQKQEYDSIKNRIVKEKDLAQLETVWKDNIDEQQKNQLYILRKQRIQILTDKVFDELKNNIKNKQVSSRLEDKRYYNNRIDLNELNDNLELTNDILKLNQTLLTRNRKINNLNTKRKQKYNNNLYDNFAISINIETNVEDLQNNWKIRIDTEIEKEYLLQPRTIENLYKLRKERIALLRQPPLPK
ncbi:1990_t:CDS:2, partial [Racocetra persica]